MNNLKKEQGNKNLTAINPKSSNFNFEVWAKQVRQQMLDVLQQKLNRRAISRDSNYQ